MDDQRLKEVLSAWFDGELSGEAKAQVEAYIERSAEAREIIARFEALKRLTDNSALNLKSDYWERSAAKIEAALGEQAITRIVPVKKTGWSNWGVKAVSIAASVVLLVYVGFHSDEILNRVHQEDNIQDEQIAPSQTSQPPDSVESKGSIIQRKAAEDKSLERFKDGLIREKTEPEEIINLPKRIKQEPVPEPEPEVTAQDSRPAEPVLEFESEAANKLRQERAKETTTATTKQPQVSAPKSTLAPALIEQYEVEPPANSLISPETSPQLVGESAKKSRTDESTALSDEANQSAPVVKVDSTREASDVEQYRYLWDHVIVQQLAEIEKGGSKPSVLDGLRSTLNGSLSARGKDRKTKEGKDQVTRDMERERRLVDAAYHVGRTSEDGGERKQALKYLEYLFRKAESREIQDYARSKWESLKQSH